MAKWYERGYRGLKSGVKNTTGTTVGFASGGLMGDERFGFVDNLVGGTLGDLTDSVGDYFGSPAKAARQQRDAAKRARGTQEQSLSDALGYMSPYEARGREHFMQMSDDITSGKYDMDPSSFSYQDRQMPGSYEMPGRYDAGQYKMPEGYQSSEYEDKPFEFEADPGYQFKLKEGEKAIQRSAAARGGLLSGGTLKDLTKYSQGLASDEYGKARGRYERDRTYGRGVHERDRAFGRGIYEGDRTFGRGVHERDRAFGQGVHERDRAFGYGVHSDEYNRAIGERGFDYGQAGDEYNRRYGAMADRYNRAAGMANIGPQFGRGLANTRMQGGTNIANAQLGVGNAQAATTMAPYNQGMSMLNTGLQVGGTILGAMAGGPAGAVGGNMAGRAAGSALPQQTQYGSSGFPSQVPLQYNNNLNYPGR